MGASVKEETAETLAWWLGHITLDEKLTLVDESIITSVLANNGVELVLETPITLEAGRYEIALTEETATFFKVERKAEMVECVKLKPE